VRPVIPDATLPAHAVETIDFLVKLGGALGAAWVATTKIWKPYVEWRREHIAKVTREVLKPELDQLRALITSESGCAEHMEAAVRGLTQVFGEMDSWMALAIDNRDRLDETNDLLDEMFSLERRVDYERRAEIDALLAVLKERAKARKRALVVLPVASPIPDPVKA
jgi:hypothetical protein